MEQQTDSDSSLKLKTFYCYVIKTPHCWRWIGPLDSEGYALTEIPGRPMRAIQFLYEMIYIPLASGKMLGLGCTDKSCVNLEHIVVLDVVTSSVINDNMKQAARLERRSLDPVMRFWSWVNKDGPIPIRKPELGSCWIWTGGATGSGYGSYLFYGKHVLAHRVAYLLEYGRLPDHGLELDHLCRNKLCVRPQHLEAVTHQENIRRAQSYRKKVNGPMGDKPLFIPENRRLKGYHY